MKPRSRVDLSRLLAENSDITLFQAMDVVEIFTNVLIDTLAEDKTIILENFFSMYNRHYKSHMGRNPVSKRLTKVPATKLPHFKCSRELKDRINKEE